MTKEKRKTLAILLFSYSVSVLWFSVSVSHTASCMYLRCAATQRPLKLNPTTPSGCCLLHTRLVLEDAESAPRPQWLTVPSPPPCVAGATPTHSWFERKMTMELTTMRMFRIT